MRWDIRASSGNGKEWRPGQLLLPRNAIDKPDAPYFIYMGKVDDYLRLGWVRFSAAEQAIETAGEIVVHSSRRSQFHKVLGLVAERR